MLEVAISIYKQADIEAASGRDALHQLDWARACEGQASRIDDDAGALDLYWMVFMVAAVGNRCKVSATPNSTLSNNALAATSFC